jgi:hypothetical protein
MQQQVKSPLVRTPMKLQRVNKYEDKEVQLPKIKCRD